MIANLKNKGRLKSAGHASAKCTGRVKPALTALLACALAASMIAPAAAVAADAASGKDETVYVKMSAAGSVEDVFVVNRFAAGTGSVVDPGEYLSVTNLTTSDRLAQGNGGVEVPLQETQPLYYEGQLDAKVALPWDISLSYWVDDKKVEPEALGGADGLVRIELAVSPRTDAAEPGVSDFANAYVLQAQGTFDASTFEIERAEGAMVAQVGGESIVSCMVLPGEESLFVLEGTARDFATSGWQISALPLSLAIDIAKQDTSQLTDATTQLEGAAGQLSSGSGSLAAGAASAIKGAGALADGAAEMRDGSADLKKGAADLEQGLQELFSKNSDLLGGWDTLSSGIGALSDGMVALLEGSDTYAAALEAAKKEVSDGAKLHSFMLSLYEEALAEYVANPTEDTKATLDEVLELVFMTSQATGAQQALEQALAGYAQLADGIEAAAEGASDLSDGSTQFGDGLGQYASGVSAAAAGSSALAEGASAVAEGAQKLFSGVGELESGLGALGNGANQLAAGTNQLAAAVQGMDTKVLDAIQEVIDQKLGADFEQHSFVAPDNTQIGTVQFVFVVDGVSADDGGAAASDADLQEEKELSIIDRILEFIRGIFS
ncbi:MAG: hypothetical protein IKV48_08465 [Eggerthellaceae bacterium]|nr:hypothetical protein [Eggerthellaceae bacterium]